MTGTKYAKDYSAGQKIKNGKRAVSEGEIIEFAAKYDPFPFHIDPQVQKNRFWRVDFKWLDDGIGLARNDA